MIGKFSGLLAGEGAGSVGEAVKVSYLSGFQLRRRADESVNKP